MPALNRLNVQKVRPTELLQKLIEVLIIKGVRHREKIVNFKEKKSQICQNSVWPGYTESAEAVNNQPQSGPIVCNADQGLMDHSLDPATNNSGTQQRSHLSVMGSFLLLLRH